MERIYKGIFPPENTNIIWLDISNKIPVLKKFNGDWEVINDFSESEDEKKIYEEISRVESKEDNKITILESSVNTELSKKVNIQSCEKGYFLASPYDSEGNPTYRKIGLNDLPDNIYPSLTYGVEFDTTVSSHKLTRIGSPALHRSLPIQNAMRGCLLDDEGNVVEYLPNDDWTTATRDGSKGQVMVEIPLHYRKCETDGTKRRVWLSEYPLPGYHAVPKRYVSAYQAALQRSTNKLSSVVNSDADYRGGKNTSDWDGTYRSVLGMPATAIKLTDYRTYARNRKSGSTAWNCMTYGTYKAIYWLYMVEYANFNSQLGYTAELTTEGYHQSGLGIGVADMPDWEDYNSLSPIIPCGVTDTLGNNTGVVTHNVIASDGESVHYAAPVPRYRGIENPFGHLRQWADGVLVEIGADSDTGLSKVYVASDPADFASTITDGYSYVGNEARTSGYIKEHIFGEGGDIIPAVVGGGSGTYLCDYHYTLLPSSGSVTRGVMFGGQAFYNARVGFASVDSLGAPSVTPAYVGSRLCYIPTTD